MVTTIRERCEGDDSIAISLDKAGRRVFRSGSDGPQVSAFGLEEKRAGQDLTNKERLHEELNDLNGIVQMLNREFGFGFMPSGIAATAKCEKVNKYYALSKSKGQVE